MKYVGNIKRICEMEYGKYVKQYKKNMRKAICETVEMVLIRKYEKGE